MSSNHLILCRPLLLLPLIFPSIRVFLSESAYRIRWLKYRSFSFSISPSSEYSGLISFRMDWLDLLAAQGILKSFSAPQFKSINSFALWLLGDRKNLAPPSSVPAQEEGRRAGGLCAPLQGSPGQGSRVQGAREPAPNLCRRVGLGAGVAESPVLGKLLFSKPPRRHSSCKRQLTCAGNYLGRSRVSWNSFWNRRWSREEWLARGLSLSTHTTHSHTWELVPRTAPRWVCGTRCLTGRTAEVQRQELAQRDTPYVAEWGLVAAAPLLGLHAGAPSVWLWRKSLRAPVTLPSRFHKALSLSNFCVSNSDFLIVCNIVTLQTSSQSRPEFLDFRPLLCFSHDPRLQHNLCIPGVTCSCQFCSSLRFWSTFLFFF